MLFIYVTKEKQNLYILLQSYLFLRRIYFFMYGIISDKMIHTTLHISC